MAKELTAEERRRLQFMLGTVRDLKSMRARAELNSSVARARAEAWRMKMGGARKAMQGSATQQ